MFDFGRKGNDRQPGAAVRSLALVVLLTSPPVARSEVYDVSVNDNFYSPNDLTIAAGDTVRWTRQDTGGGCDPYYGCGGGEGGVAHTVTSDDGLFSSGAPAPDFVFEYTFDDAGEYRYYCEQHSQPGRDIDLFMNGRIVVESTASGFQITSGLNDAWFNPETGGQGFFVTVFPDIGRMFVAWFTFDVERPPDSVSAQLGDPGHRWITAFGAYADNQAVLDIEVTTGGVFDAAEPEPMQHPDGTLTLEFTGCDAGTVTYDIPSLDLSGAVPIQRLANDNIALCESESVTTQ